MKQDTLYISFLLGTQKKVFQLPLKNYQKLEAAGLTIGHKYELDVNSTYFVDFYKYIRDKFGVLYENKEVLASKVFTANKATIEQKKGEPGQPWNHLLLVLGTFRVEKIVFYPDICGKDNEEEDVEYQEDVKRADLIKSLVTTLPEEYRDTNIKEERKEGLKEISSIIQELGGYD